ncbi:MAG: hypothetical protein ACR2NN_27215 [Bryobacteraceae bacterium]
MKISVANLLFCALFTVYAQDTDVFTKAPPEVDEALRARITTFYQAHITGKYRDAFQVVADEAQDDFIAASKDTYKGCEITKINYSEDFTKASVVTACKGEFRWRNERVPATLPLATNWKLVNGQWYWYLIKRDKMVTPFGISSVTPDNGDGAKNLPAIPADPAAIARDILSKVSVDKTEIQLKGYETSQDKVQITNDMPGPIRITVNSPGSTGLAIKLDKNELAAGEKAAVLFDYSVEDAKAVCHDCFKPVKPAVSADIRIEPTGQVFHVNVTFAIPPELQKQIPSELQKKP